MTIRSLRLLSLMMVALLFCACGRGETAGSCNAIEGKWNWFVGGEVTVKADGTFEQQSGNSGTWECTDGAAGRFVFKWKVGGFVNPMVLSGDGRALSSTDPAQSFVSAQRVGGSVAQQPVAQQSNESASLAPGYSQEVGRLVARMDASYRGSSGHVTFGDWGLSGADDNFFDDSITRAESLTLTDGFVLRVGVQVCARPWGSEQVVSVADCDGERNGLKWKSETYPMSLANVKVSSINVSGNERVVGYSTKDDELGVGALTCRDKGACTSMVADLRQLVTLAQGSAATPQPAVARPAQASASSDVAKDVAQRMERINRAYKGSVMLADEVVAVQRGVRVTLEKGFVLKFHSQWCDGSDSPRESEYDSANGVEKQIRDCDAKRDSLYWEDSVTEFVLPQVKLVSSTVPKTKGPPHVDFRVLQREGDVSTFIGCKADCTQLALDLAAIVNLAHRAAGQR